MHVLVHMVVHVRMRGCAGGRDLVQRRTPSLPCREFTGFLLACLRAKADCMLSAQAAASACLGVRWKSMRRSAACTFVVMLSASAAAANPASEALRTRAAAEFYNLNIDQALALYREAVAADPGDSR